MTDAKDDSKPNRPPITLTAGNLRSLATRLEARATSMLADQPHGASDLATAARFIQHALRVGWVITSVVVNGS